MADGGGRRRGILSPWRAAVGASVVAGLLLVQASAQQVYFPPKGDWARKAPAEVGMDAGKLAEAVAFARINETDWPNDFSTQEEIFGSLLGPMPNTRAATNGLVIRHGYVVASFGDTRRADPTYSVAKSMLSTVAGVAVRKGLLTDLDEPMARKIHDGGYDAAHNAPITWRMHLQQETEWQGEMFGKRDDFVGAQAFGAGERKPRALQAPGTYYEYNDVRINRFALSLLRIFEAPVPVIFKNEVMDVIGASDTWEWVPYKTAYVDQGGTMMPSVSGGTRWGGGVWINAEDMARFGYLWLRGGQWNGREIVPAAYVTAATTPSVHGPDYGYLWWLNTRQRNWPGLPASAYGARGAGSNTIFISPEHDLVIVWRWHGGRGADARFFRMVVDAITE
ncbi:MAG: serine hydrolase domain-containing protein [Vicinamibacterales bacterium]